MKFFAEQLRHVLRSLLRSPMFTAVTLLTIGIGVGANTAIFSVIDGVLLKPLPYPQPERLVSVWQTSQLAGLKDLELSPADYFTFREENRTFLQFGMWDGGNVTITGIATPERVRTVSVTDGALDALGIQPMLGRWFTAKEDEPGSPGRVMLSYGFWQRKFGGDPSVLGRQLRIDGEAKEIIGVMPASFRFLEEKPDLLLPFQLDRAKTHLGNYSFQSIARLKPGVSLAQANADVGRMIPMVVAKFPPPPGFSVKMFEGAHIRPALRPLKRDVVGDLSGLLWILMGSIGVVLLIACANVANLVLVRTEGRQQELAVRAALGAGPRRIAGALLAESAVLGVLGGAVGLALAYASLRVLLATAPANLPRIENISIDSTALLFTLAISLFSGLLFGVIPVLKYASPNVMRALRSGGRTLSQSKEAHRTRNLLVVLQVALAVVLLIGSGLMIRTFQALRRVQPGFTAPAALQTLRVDVPDGLIKDPVQVMRMFQEIQRKMSAMPGVSSAAFANSVPTDGNHSTDVLFAQDRTYAEGEIPPLRRFKFVAPGFFQTMGTPWIAGRDFTWADLYDERPVAVVSESLARQQWRDPASAIGKRIREGMNDPWREVIGVAGDV
ncbi:MAG: ABC transporter permease, partial [Bryobacteraceae bacterium]